MHETKKNLNNKLAGFSKPPHIAEQNRVIKESAFSGTVVLFDLTESTKSKQEKDFPGWVPDLMQFHKTIFENISWNCQWYKFLGDAYMFFFSDKIHSENNAVPEIITYEETTKIINSCEEVMNKYWEFYKLYSQKSKKGGSKNKEFRQMSCAIDYGDDIINWPGIIDSNATSSAGTFDPIGTPIDRCFRISNMAGPSQILVSSNFYNKKIKTCQNDKNSYVEKFEKINIAENSLKGLPDETTVYYLVPPDSQKDHMLDEENAELVENATKMTTKIKIKLLRKNNEL